MTDHLQQGHDACAARAWSAAVAALRAADESAPLEPPDLELLSTALFMVGLEDEHVAVLARAYESHLRAGDLPRAASCAFWIGMRLTRVGELGRGGGWLARAQRALQQHGRECVEQGYLLMPEVFRAEASGDLEKAIATAARGLRSAGATATAT